MIAMLKTELVDATNHSSKTFHYTSVVAATMSSILRPNSCNLSFTEFSTLSAGIEPLILTIPKLTGSKSDMGNCFGLWAASRSWKLAEGRSED